MDRVISLGIMGCSAIAEKSMIANFTNSGCFRIQSIASRDYLKAKSYAEKFGGSAIEGYQNLVEDSSIECVYISLPTGMHYEWAKKCIESGKHVFLEKSFCQNYKETEDLIALSEEYGVVVFENFMFQENDQFKEVTKLLVNKVIGEIKFFRSTFCFPIFNEASNIRYNKSLGGGALLDAGAYVLKGAKFILNTPIKVIHAIRFNSEKYDVDFHGYITIQTPTGIIGQLAFGFDNHYQNNIEIIGTKGKIILERAYTSPKDFYHEIQLINEKNELTIIPIYSSNPGVIHCKRFANLILSNNKLDLRNNNQSILSQSKLLEETINLSS